MKDSDSSYIEHLFNEFSYLNRENSLCQGIETVSIIVNKKRWKKRKKQNVFEPIQHPPIAFRLSKLSKPNKRDYVSRHSSMPELSECTRHVLLRNKSGHWNDTKQTKIKQNAFQTKFIANIVSEHRSDNWFLNPFNYSSQTKWKIYRCQLGAVEDSCCCSCNSDAMFEVMKGLYDCYKAKNCDGCECVLCGYKTAEERKLDALRKSMTSAAREKLLEGKTPEEKEFILKEMAKTKQPLPSGKTPSDKALIDKIRKDLGLPPAPKNALEKSKMRKAEAAGIITPLEGKSPEQKEKILRAQADMGLPLPEGRTDSEKALIKKVKEEAKKRSLKTALLTPLTGKTPEEKEKILRGRAMKGLPLPEAQTPSEKKLIAKVRGDLGLPKDPTTKSMRLKHDQAAKAGLLQPLEDKTPEEKEKILRGLRSFGIPLPEGRTPSEKALIAKVKAEPRTLVSPSEQMRRAKAEGLVTALAGKTPEQKEKIIRGLAMKGLPLPEATTPSEKNLINKVRADLGLPKEPDTKSMKTKYEQAAKAGLLQPLEGQTPEEKEKTLKGLHDLGIPLPEGRTPSEKALVAKVKSLPKGGSIKTAGVMTPLAGKSPEQKEKVLKARAKKGIPLPEGTTPSEKKLIEKVRNDLGLPKEPDTKSMKAKHEAAAKAGLLEPLEGKTPAQKEAQLKGLRDMGIPLPEGRTPSEKALIAKIKGAPRSMVSPSEQLRRAKAEGLMTPLAGKTPAQKEKILKGLAMKGIPLPEGTTPSEKKLIDKVRDDLGLPKEPDTKSLKDKYEKAAKAGLLQPLLGKTPEEKEKILQGQYDMGIPLPEGRTPSEKALVAKIKALPAGSIKTAGLMEPLAGKSPVAKEKILRARAKRGIPLPEATSPSEKKLIDKVRADLGLPKEPDTKSMKAKYDQAAKAGLLEPLEGKTPAQKEAQLKGLRDMGIPLPEGRTPSEKALIAKVKGAPRSMVSPSEQLRRAKAEGLMTPLTGKTPAQKEKILKGLAMKGIPLPEGKTPSEKKLIDKVREDLGLPKEPDTKSLKDKYEKAAKAGLLQPLVGKTPEEKEKILQGQYDLGIPLPEGRTPSEKALINKIKAVPAGSIKTAGVMEPLAGKSPAAKEKILRARAKKGIPLPEGTTPSEKKLIDKVRADLGLPKEPDTKSMRAKHEQAAKAGLLEPLEGKTPAQKEALLKGLRDMGIPLPEGRTPSEKALISKLTWKPRSLVSPSEQLRRAKAEGLMTPLAGKTPAQKEKILKGLAMKGIPLPEAKTPSEKKLMDKVREDLGLPKEPDTKSMKDKYEQAAKAGVLQPLVGKTPEEKEKILQGLHDLGIPLPEGRTPSEKALVAKVKALPPGGSIKSAGLMTPLAGKPPPVKEKILRARAKKGIPLPEGTTPSEKKLIDKVRADLGLPKEPDTKSMKAKHEQAAKAGLLEPLEGKTPAQKEAQLKGLRDMGIPLPEGRTPSEKALIAKVKGAPRSMVSPSEQLRRAKAEGLMTPLAGKTPAQKEKILKGLAMKGIPLPEGKTPSEKKLIDKVREDLGLPKEPDTKSLKDKYEKAAKAGLLQPLVGKTPEEKEKILQGQYDLGIPLPEGRTPSEKALIDKIKAVPAGSIKTAGVMEPLAGKSPTAKEKILRARAKKGIPLPEGTTPSEKKLIDKVRADLGLPKEPDTRSMKAKHEQAAKVGLLEPLEGKTPAQKEAQLKGLRDMGIPLPEGRTPSEKALIAKIKAAPRSMVSPSEQLRRAKAEGLMTPLAGKTPAQKEKILKGLAMKGIPLPEGKSPSEKQLIDKVRDDLGLPKEPDTKSLKDKYDQAAKAGFLQPLAGKTPEEKEKILQGQHNLGIPLPEGRTPSEKALIAKIKAAPRAAVAPSEQLRRAKAEGLLTPLKGKKPEQKEKIIKGLAMKGLPLPIPKTPSEKKLVNKIRAELGLPKEPTTKEERDQHEKAAKAGLLRPLEGMTPDEKEKTLKGLAELGIPLPEGRTPSEKSLIAKVKATTKKKESVPSITTEKIKQAKKAGLFTPLKGKTHDQKEKILRGLAEAGLPLPPPKTASEKKLVKELKEEFGIPDRTPSEKLRRAKDHGLLTPLAGKSRPQKEKILRGRAAAGFPLPKDGTPSEKALIKKIKAETGYVSPSQAEKAKRAKAAGLMTPLEGKSPEEQEKILKGLAELGLPLPEGTTPSEKSVIAKFKARIPPEAKTPSEKSIIRKAKAAGLFTPIAGKSPEEQEKILKGLADAGLPLPEGKTDSEKSLIKKIRAQAGLPPEPTPSEKKGGIRKKGKMVGVSASKKEKETGKELGKGIEGEEIEEIVKTTKCDRACGCTRKKIKFKHSYVKIRVTSPDISSFCDCPDECLPGVKAGAFVDNDGIKVTIGSAVGIPSYSMMCINEGIPDKMVTNIDLSKAQTNYYDNVDVLKNFKYKFSSFESGLNNNGNKGNVNINISSSDISYNTKLYNTHSDNNCVYNRIPHNKGRTSKFENIMESFKDLQSMEYIYKKPMSETKSSSSFETILIIRNDMSLSTSTSNSTGSISLTSNMRSSISSSSAQYSGYQSTNDLLSINSLDGPTTSDDYIDHPTIRQRNALRNIGVAIPQQYTILRMTQLEHKFGNNKLREKDLETKDPIVLLNRSPSKLGVSKIMLKIMARKCFDGASAMFIVVPMSEDEEEQESTKGVDSMTSVRSSERHFTANTTSVVVPGM
ncbi:hypothetical protein PYW08_000555 [Mythimna loreyi]|uniref:Uncharacterized protein n=1 Tax=Mythimna loreyi TaxID=667449 RepID=A0ACC2RCT8_9NEOP|nr:hypothetical protein PYW08_000555 [Mythimna loreyi]